MAKKGEKILTKKRVEKIGLNKVSVITADMLKGYTTIGEHAFHGCHYLSSIEIPNNITRIGFAAFHGCHHLTSVTIPNSVASIGNRSFCNCRSLTSITIPNSITRIEAWTFFVCSGLTSVTIPNSVTSIGIDTFGGCRSLTSVTIGDKTYEKQTITNGKCKAYKAFNANMTCRDFQYEEGKTYELKGKPKMCEQGFHACLNLADVFNYYAGMIGRDIVIHEVELEDVSDDINDSKVVAKKITIGKRIL